MSKEDWVVVIFAWVVQIFIFREDGVASRWFTVRFAEFTEALRAIWTRSFDDSADLLKIIAGRFRR